MTPPTGLLAEGSIDESFPCPDSPGFLNQSCQQQEHSSLRPLCCACPALGCQATFGCVVRGTAILTCLDSQRFRLMRSWAQTRAPGKQILRELQSSRGLPGKPGRDGSWSPTHTEARSRHGAPTLFVGLTHSLMGSQWVHKILKCYLVTSSSTRWRCAMLNKSKTWTFTP